IHLTISLQKLQQKALQQPKQKKSKSAEFLMGEEERDGLVGTENPPFDGGQSTALSVPPVRLGREIRGDRPDSTLAAHQKKMELQASAKERGNKCTQNYFDPLSAEQTDLRHCRMAGVGTEDELELITLEAEEKRLYQRMTALLDGDDTAINIPVRNGEVSEVKAGDPMLQRQLLLHSGGDASGSRASKAHSIAKTQTVASAVLEEDPGLEAGRLVMGRKSTIKMRTAKEVIPHYAQQLRERVRPDMITLGSLSLQQVSATKRNICVIIPYSPAHQPLCLFVCACSSTTTESLSLRALGEGQEDAMAKIGQLTELLGSSSSASRPQWQVNQSSTPQPVEVCVCCLRATREKLPQGLYTVHVGLHSHLGGPPLAWCNERKQQQWSVSTEPIEHLGCYYSSDLHVNQSMLMILPAACEVVPSMALVFQLIALPGHSVLAWGAFPVFGSGFRHVQGRFKTPLLRGEPNTQVDQFKKIEGLISSDLDHWLCNLYFQVFPIPFAMPQSEACHKQLQGNLPCQPQPSPQAELHPQSIHSQSQLYLQQQQHACSSCTAGAVVHSHQGSPLHLSADSACSSSSLPGRGSMLYSPTIPQWGENKKPIKKTNSCGPSMSGSSALPRQAGERKTPSSVENLSTEEMEEYTFSLQSALTGSISCPPSLSDRVRLALRMLPSELGLPLPWQHLPRSSWRGSVWQLGLIILLLALMWFVRLYLHYCSQWLYLQAVAVPVNKFQFHAHTVDLMYQSSLLHTREELAMVVVGPLTLNAVTFLLVLIRWGCQQIFGSLPSFTSKFIMAQGVWTVLDPLAVFAVDAVLGHLAYSPDRPVGDAGITSATTRHLLSHTIPSRFHNDGGMLDVFQRLTAKEGTFFLPLDLELSNRELSYIVRKAEQWRGFNGERRKVAVYDHIWTMEDPLANSVVPSELPREGEPHPEGETRTHVEIYTLFQSGQRQRYRHFIRQPDGAIIEVRYQHK
uniref:Uncharacterized protein n=1 Tax=Mola mola TaxID=94237 RepID=A0A3Q3VXF9_MOLML